MKRYLVLIISIILSLSGIPLPCAAGAAELSDIEGTKYRQSAELLYDIGIIAGYDDGTFKPEREVSRGELCAIITRVLELDEVDTPYSGRFTDIENSPYRTYIETLAGMNIVDGVGGGLFEPDAKVLTEQVIKIAVCAVNYDKTRSGLVYPESYISIATERGLLKNISSKVGENMIRGEIAILIENLLEADYAELTYGASAGIDFKNTSNMYEILDIDKVFGTMTANDDANIMGGALPGKGIIAITTSDGEITANPGVLDVNDSLGKKGYFYIRNNGDDDAEVMHFRESSNQNKTIDIAADSFDYAEIADGGEKISIHYYVGTSRKNQKLETGSRVFYNGKQVAAGDVTEDLLDIDDGTIRLMSVGESGYDTVFITDYMSFAVSSVKESESEVYVKPNRNKINGETVQSLILDKDDPSMKLTVTYNGEEIDITELREYDIITVMTTLDKETVTVTVSRDTAEGSVSRVGTSDSDEDICEINGTEYPISSAMNDTIKINDTGIFYLNSFGRITYFDVKLNSGSLYGYLMKTFQEEGDGDYICRVLNQNGEKEDLRLDGKVRFNDISQNDAAVFAALTGSNTLISYKANADGKITSLDTAADNGASDYIGYDTNNFSKDNNTADGSMYFKSTSIPGFGGRYLIDDDTVIFTVPSDLTDYDNYRVANSSYFVNDIYYNVDIYDTDRSMVAAAVVSKGIDETKSDEQSLSWNEPIMLVDEIREEVGDDDDIVRVLYGLKSGKEVSVVIADEDSDGEPVVSEAYGDWQGVEPGKIKEGSVIQYKTNIDGEMDDFRILYVPGASMRITNLDANSNHKVECQTVVGLADVCRDGIIKVTLNGGASYNAATGKVFAIGNANIYSYDANSRNSKLENALADDILSRENVGDSASKVFIRANKENVGDIVIYK